MNEDKKVQRNDLISDYITSRMLFKKLNFWGTHYTRASPEIQLINELGSLGWDCIEGKLISQNIFETQTYLNAQQNFRHACEGNEGYQRSVLPLSLREIRYTFLTGCPELAPMIKNDKIQAKLYLNQAEVVTFLGETLLVDVVEDLSIPQRLTLLCEAEKGGKIEEMIRQSHLLIHQRNPFDEKNKEHLLFAYRVQAYIFEALSESPINIDYDSSLKNFYLTCFAINLLYATNVKTGRFINESKDTSKLKKRIHIKLNKLIQQSQHFYPALINFAEKNRTLIEKMELFKALSELYKEDVFLSSRYRSLLTLSEEVTEAKRLVKQGKYVEAIKAYTQLISLCRKESLFECTNYYSDIIYLYLKTNQCDKALESANEANALLPDAIELNITKAAVSYRQKNFEEAVLIYQNLLFLLSSAQDHLFYSRAQITTYYIRSTYNLGKSYTQLQQYKEALIEYLKLAPKALPQSFDLHRRFVLIRILHAYYQLDEETRLAFEEKIKVRKVFYYVLSHALEHSHYLNKTFQLLSSIPLSEEFLNELVLHFLKNGKAEKIVELGHAIYDNHPVKLKPETFSLFLKALVGIFESSILKIKENKRLLSNLYEIALSDYGLNEGIYCSVIHLLYLTGKNLRIYQLYIQLISTDFQFYLKLPKPPSAILHYDLGVHLLESHLEESFLRHEQALELGIKNIKKNKKLYVCCLNILSLAFKLNKNKHEITSLQKIINLASTSDLFYSEFLPWVLNSSPKKELHYELLIGWADALVHSPHKSKTLKSLDTYLKPVELFPDRLSFYLSIFLLYESLNRSKLSSEEILSFYHKISGILIQSEKISSRIIEEVSQSILALPSSPFSCNLLYQLANLYPESASLLCDSIIELQVHFPTLTEAHSERFIQLLMDANEYQKAIHYHLETKGSLVFHQKVIHWIYQEKFQIPTSSLIKLLGIDPHDLYSACQLFMLQPKIDSHFCTQFIETLESNSEKIAPFYSIFQLFKAQKNQNKLLYPLVELILLETESSERKEKIEDFCLQATQLFLNTYTFDDEIVEDFIKRIRQMIPQDTPIYRKISHILNKKSTLNLPNKAKKIFDSLTDELPWQWVFLTGSQVLSFLDKEFTPSDWDFVLLDDSEISHNILIEKGFWRCNHPGLERLFTQRLGFPIEVYCVEGPLSSSQEDLEKYLKKEASKRDFTICAILVDAYGNLYDYYHGIQDFQDRILRTTGPAYEILSEDPVRFLRAVKYLMKGFKWDDDIYYAIQLWTQTQHVILQPTQEHLVHLMTKHLSSLDISSRLFYIDILLKTNLWNKLLTFENQIKIKNKFQLYALETYYPMNNMNIFWHPSNRYLVPKNYSSEGQYSKSFQFSLNQEGENN